MNPDETEPGLTVPPTGGFSLLHISAGTLPPVTAQRADGSLLPGCDSACGREPSLFLVIVMRLLDFFCAVNLTLRGTRVEGSVACGPAQDAGWGFSAVATTKDQRP